MIFVELRSFEREREKHLSDDEFAEFQLYLIQRPEAGSVIKGSGGLRKIRWHDAKSDRGKRGSKRVIYFIRRRDTEIWLVAIYDKSEIEKLDPSEIRFLRKMIETVQS